MAKLMNHAETLMSYQMTHELGLRNVHLYRKGMDNAEH
jgi:hypothetical protein